MSKVPVTGHDQSGVRSHAWPVTDTSCGCLFLCNGLNFAMAYIMSGEGDCHCPYNFTQAKAPLGSDSHLEPLPDDGRRGKAKPNSLFVNEVSVGNLMV